MRQVRARRVEERDVGGNSPREKIEDDNVPPPHQAVTRVRGGARARIALVPWVLDLERINLVSHGPKLANASMVRIALSPTAICPVLLPNPLPRPRPRRLGLQYALDPQTLARRGPLWPS